MASARQGIREVGIDDPGLGLPGRRRGEDRSSGECEQRGVDELAGSLAIICTGLPTAHALTRYRYFLPDLAGLAGLRRVGPGTS